jgi:hypothetical protein
VFCSLKVYGIVSRQATTMWGDVDIESTGYAESIQVNGGSVRLAPGAGLQRELSAFAGSVRIEPGAHAPSSIITEWPGFFYPGQRSWPRGIFFFAFLVLLISVCGGEVMSKEFANKMGNALQRPFSSAAFGIVMWPLSWLLLWVGGIALYLFPPLAFLFYFGTPLVLWLALAVGIAAVSEELGSGLGHSDPLKARVTGASTLVALMLIPIMGALVMLALMLLGSGASMRTLVWPRWQRVPVRARKPNPV